jgi:hypothetical protein
MRIQEMRPGILHLRKKMENEGPDEYFNDTADTAIVGEQAPLPADTRTVEAVSDLEQPRWSLVSFERIEAGGLTYKQAIALMAELDNHGIPGLCIITDQAAYRLKS